MSSLTRPNRCQLESDNQVSCNRIVVITIVVVKHRPKDHGSSGTLGSTSLFVVSRLNLSKEHHFSYAALYDLGMLSCRNSL